MASLMNSTSLFITAVLFFAVWYLVTSVWSRPVPSTKVAPIVTSDENKIDNKPRDIVRIAEESGKDCVVFFGSQTGTAENLAGRLATEGQTRFGLKAMVANLENYDYEYLDAFPAEKLAIFVLATYGEGEPTDNAAEFYYTITGQDIVFSKGKSADQKPLSNLRYLIFGLGNDTYEHFNGMAKTVDSRLQRLGATRVGELGQGDDGAGTMEEDFLAWKDQTWKTLVKLYGLSEHETPYEPLFELNERPDRSTDDNMVYLGEHNQDQLEGNFSSPFGATNPYIAPIAVSKQLFTAGGHGRDCVHMDIDFSGCSDFSYTTGDHIAVQPNNPSKEVDRFLQILGLEMKRNMVIEIKPFDRTINSSVPTPTTYDSILRFYLEICGLVSRQLVSTLAAFAPEPAIKKEMLKIGHDKEVFQQEVTKFHFNIAQLLEVKSGGEPWINIPFSIFLENLKPLRPRYYSISSSSLAQRDKVSITAVVESIQMPGSPFVTKGVATNYLLALKQAQHGESEVLTGGSEYSLQGPRNRFPGLCVPVSIRQSSFRLPLDPSTPIIMIGPGTGVAPFRGFIQERAAQARNGARVGSTVLFYGCRRRSEDYVYAQEWELYKRDIGNSFEMYTAFSRDGPDKIYVQHKLMENAAKIDKLLQGNAHLYICGDARRMARDVNAALCKIISEQRQVKESDARDILKKLKDSSRYLEDVW